MKILVAVASKHGSTREIAEAVADELRTQGLSVDLHDVSSVREIAGYEAVVLGSAVYSGNWLPEAKRFAEQFHAALSNAAVWLFSSGPLGEDNPRPPADLNQFAAPLGGVQTRDHQVFVGKLDLDTLGLAERYVVNVAKVPSGDFRDWNGIREWARSIASELLKEHAH